MSTVGVRGSRAEHQSIETAGDVHQNGSVQDRVLFCYHVAKGCLAMRAEPKTLRFDAFALDLVRSSLWRGDEEIRLRPKTFDLLRYLTENPGRLMSKDELIEAASARLSGPVIPSTVLGSLLMNGAGAPDKQTLNAPQQREPNGPGE